MTPPGKDYVFLPATRKSVRRQRQHHHRPSSVLLLLLSVLYTWASRAAWTAVVVAGALITAVTLHK